MTINVQKNGVTQFTADDLGGVHGNDWNFITRDPPPSPPGRLTTAIVTWMTHSPFTKNTDMQFWKNVAGVISNNDPPVDWPYIGTQFKWQMPAVRYTAFQVNVPTNAPVTTHYVKGASYSGSAPLRISISRTPGDFNPATALRVIEDVTPENGKIIYFRNSPGTSFYVGMDPGGVYYINVMPMDNSRTQPAGLTCG